MIIRYKIDNARLLGRLDRAPDASGVRASWLVVTYETDHNVSHLEARRDCELLSATHQELEALRGAGYDIPDYPEDPGDDEQREIRARYDKVKGSAVNSVLCQGNSDRRVPDSVKQYVCHHLYSINE